MPAKRITIAVDAVGGDHAPDAVLAGVAAALGTDSELEVALVGPPGVVDPFAAEHERCEPVHASEIIEMGEHPANSVRGKKDSSIVVACRLVHEGRADAAFSAGNTGAMMAAAILVIGRIPNVSRPAIAAVIPTSGDPFVFLDVGANADYRPEHLLQFAHMGEAYSRAVLGVEEPRVALLNIGGEEAKGSIDVQEAYELLSDHVPGFGGNIEGGGLFRGRVDVVVTDGFTGNVALKLMEGMSATIFGEMRGIMTSTAASKMAAAVLKPALTQLHDRLDPETYGAAPLLGIDGLALIGHGASGPRAVASALRVGATAVRGDVVGLTRDALAEEIAEEA